MLDFYYKYTRVLLHTTWFISKHLEDNLLEKGGSLPPFYVMLTPSNFFQASHLLCDAE